MKYVIIGSALSGNKGAAAMLESSIQTLGERDPKAEFTLLSMYPVRDQEQNRYDNLTVLKASPIYLALVINSLALLWRLLPFARSFFESKSRQIQAIAEADAFLDQGGITFVDGREKFLLYNVASILPAIFMKRPVIKCAQALGTFNGFINRTTARTFLPKMALIVSRGAITHKHLEELGLENVSAGADYAFALDVTEKEKQSAAGAVDMEFFSQGKVVGISPSVVVKSKIEASGKDYVAIMSDFINHLIDEKNYRVVIIPHSARSNTEKVHNNDLPLCSDIYQQVVSKDNCMFIDKEMGSQELRYIIGECDLFVASRFHAMVSALAMQIPVLVIGWSHKYKEVLDMFELEEWAFGHDNLEHDYLEQRFDDLESQQGKVRKLLSKHLPAVKSKSLAQAEEIIKIAKKK